MQCPVCIRLPSSSATIMLLATVLLPTALPMRPSARVSGYQPRGNAIVRPPSVSRDADTVSDELLARQVLHHGLNVNGAYWMRRTGKVTIAPEAALRQADLDRRRLRAELRLQAHVERRGDEQRSNAVAAARLCASLNEARRLECQCAPLLRQAESLLFLLERAAADEYARGGVAARSGRAAAARRRRADSA